MPGARVVRDAELGCLERTKLQSTDDPQFRKDVIFYIT